MVRIKLARVGKSKETSFRLIVTDRAKDTYGHYLEVVGFYNPRSKPKVIKLRPERILYWIGKGAQPTNSVHNLLVDQGMLKAPKVKVNRTTKNSKTAEGKEEEILPSGANQQQEPQESKEEDQPVSVTPLQKENDSSDIPEPAPQEEPKAQE